MADYNVALGVKQPEPVNYLGQMAQVMALRAAQNEMQGSEATNAALQGGQRDPYALLQYGKQGRAAAESILKMRKDERETQKTEAEVIDKRLSLSRQMLDGIDPSDPNAAQKYLAWHKANHSDPILGSYLAARGVTPESSMANIEAALQRPDGLKYLIDQSKMGVEKMAENNRVSANAQLAADTSVKTTAMNNATTRRGQDLTDTRARWIHQNPNAHIVQDEEGNFVGINPQTLQANSVLPPGTPPPRNNLAPTNTPSVDNALNAGATGFTTIPQADITLKTIDFTRAAAPSAAPAAAAPTPLKGKQAGLTEVQAKSTGFASRAQQAHNILNAVGNNGEVQPGLIKRSVEAIPLVGGGLGTATNWTQSEAQQQVEQAQRNFVNAILRQESGAAVNQGEFDNAIKQYFPQPGDEPKTIAQKRQNRETAIKALETAAGPGIKRSKAAGAGGSSDDPLGLR